MPVSAKAVLDIEARNAEVLRVAKENVAAMQRQARATRSLQRTVRGLRRDMVAATSTVSQWSLALGAAASAGLVTAARSSAQLATDLRYLSRQTGLTVDDAQALSYVFAGVGADAERSREALLTFAESAGEAFAEGQGERWEIFDALGVGLRDAQGRMRDTKELLLETAEALERVRDPGERLFVARTLFGDEDARIIDAFRDGSLAQQLAAAREEATLLSQEQVTALANLESQTQALAITARTEFASLVASYAPQISEFLDRLREIAPDILKATTEAARGFVEALGEAYEMAGFLRKALLDIAGIYDEGARTTGSLAGWGLTAVAVAAVLRPLRSLLGVLKGIASLVNRGYRRFFPKNVAPEISKEGKVIAETFKKVTKELDNTATRFTRLVQLARRAGTALVRVASRVAGPFAALAFGGYEVGKAIHPLIRGKPPAAPRRDQSLSGLVQPPSIDPAFVGPPSPTADEMARRRLFDSSAFIREAPLPSIDDIQTTSVLERGRMERELQKELMKGAEDLARQADKDAARLAQRDADRLTRLRELTQAQRESAAAAQERAMFDEAITLQAARAIEAVADRTTEWQRLLESLHYEITDLFTSFVMGATSASDALKQLFALVQRELLNQTFSQFLNVLSVQGPSAPAAPALTTAVVPSVGGPNLGAPKAVAPTPTPRGEEYRAGKAVAVDQTLHVTVSGGMSAAEVEGAIMAAAPQIAQATQEAVYHSLADDPYTRERYRR